MCPFRQSLLHLPDRFLQDDGALTIRSLEVVCMYADRRTLLTRYYWSLLAVLDLNMRLVQFLAELLQERAILVVLPKPAEVQMKTCLKLLEGRYQLFSPGKRGVLQFQTKHGLHPKIAKVKSCVLLTPVVPSERQQLYPDISTERRHRK